MNEDIGNVEADLEMLMAALELAGTLAEQSRRHALRLMRHLRKDPPRSRAEWADRAQLMDANGKDLGWLDTSAGRRIDLADTSGAGDRGIAQQPAAEGPGRGPGELVELEGQFFEVHAAAGTGAPEQVRPISREEAQARIEEHRPDLSVAVSQGPEERVQITRTAATEPTPQQRAEREASAPARAGAEGPAAVWDETPAAAVNDAGGGRRSAAEAFGAGGEQRGREPGQESPAAPSEAELSAVGATKQAETTLRR